jgi:type I restriction enzyme R subunit
VGHSGFTFGPSGFTQRLSKRGDIYPDTGGYVKVGVDELALEKLSPLLKLKYHNSIPDAVADLGKPQEISRIFVDFQQYLYQPLV